MSPGLLTTESWFPVVPLSTAKAWRHPHGGSDTVTRVSHDARGAANGPLQSLRTSWGLQWAVILCSERTRMQLWIPHCLAPTLCFQSIFQGGWGRREARGPGPSPVLQAIFYSSHGPDCCHRPGTSAQLGAGEGPPGLSAPAEPGGGGCGRELGPSTDRVAG